MFCPLPLHGQRWLAPALLCSLTALVLPKASVWAADPAAEEAEKAENSDKPEKPEKAKDAEKDQPKTSLKTKTEGKITLAGESVAYEVETDTLGLLNEKDETTASVFYVYYRRTKVDQAEKRPLVFCFNGGPGSSAVWLHLGGLGPRRVVLPADGTTAPAPPFALEDNPDCLLDKADLVFVDPVNTGFSRPEKGKDAKQFHGYREDVGYLADFISRFVSEHDRWQSPKHLLGESYGALRVSALADTLQQDYGMYLNGVVLLSGLLDFRTLSTSGGNDLPYLCFLPSFAACAHYHGKIANPPALAEHLKKAREFAFGPYATALLAGRNLDAAQKSAIAAQLEALTAVSAKIWLAANLRLDSTVFRKQLLLAESHEIGRFDGRVMAPAQDLLSPSASV